MVWLEPGPPRIPAFPIDPLEGGLGRGCVAGLPPGLPLHSMTLCKLKSKQTTKMAINLFLMP